MLGALDLLQAVRNDLRLPMRVLSGHRCALHNARVGGAPRSQHLGIAFDIWLDPRIDPAELLGIAREHYFTGFGFYEDFLHMDLGPARTWPQYDERPVKWQF